MVVDGDYIRGNWNIHKNFKSELADFGWLLSLENLEIIQNAEAYYFYRSHQNQMSRKANIESAWGDIFPFWLRKMQNIFPEAIQVFNNNSSKLWLCLVFPSALLKLTKDEKKLMDDLVNELLQNYPFNSISSKEWRETLTRRKIIATRRVRISEVVVAFRLAIIVVLHLSRGIVPRKGVKFEFDANKG
jgi:hypothetical protein